MVVFGGYLVWDIVTKAVISESGSRNFLRRLFGREFWRRGWISFSCAVLSLLAWSTLHAVSGQEDVLCADMSLLSLVFLFRAMKEKARVTTAICLAGFVVFLIIAVWLNSNQSAVAFIPSID